MTRLDIMQVTVKVHKKLETIKKSMLTSVIIKKKILFFRQVNRISNLEAYGFLIQEPQTISAAPEKCFKGLLNTIHLYK